MLAEDAIKSAIRDYRSKRQNIAPTIGPEAAAAAAASVGSTVASPVG
jgi:hypothetical protein